MAEAKLLLAQTELERTRLLRTSPGQILEVKFHAGELIELQNQPPVITMADTSRLRVRAYVEELDAANVKPGMLAKITADGMPGRVIEGQVVEVMPRMSFKQVWTDRPDERFDVKTREVLIELRDARDHALARAAAWNREDDAATSDGDAKASVEPDEPGLGNDAGLVYGLPVEVEIGPLVLPMTKKTLIHLRQSRPRSSTSQLR